MSEMVVGLSSTEKASLLKMIVDHPQLQQYLHPDTPGRVPVKIKSDDLLGTGLTIRKFGKPIQFVTSSQNEVALEVLAFRLNDGRVEFEVAYEVEGVTMRGILAKRNEQWSFERVEVEQS